jgi:hypothetical protein
VCVSVDFEDRRCDYVWRVPVIAFVSASWNMSVIAIIIAVTNCTIIAANLL